MTIKYLWENVRANVICDNGDYPRTKPITTDIEYDFEVEPTQKDIDDYYGGNKPSVIDIDSLEEDDDFYDFMKERYDNKAFAEWGESNDEL